MPWFTTWIAFHCLFTIIMFSAYRLGSKHLYALLYWSEDFLDLLLQITVVLEIARSVMRRNQRWVGGSQERLVRMAVIGPVIALLMTWLMKPAADTRLDAIVARSSLFTTILVFLLFVGVVMASHQLGLGWRSYVMRESYGLVTWVTLGFMTDGLHAYWRTLGHFTLLANVQIAVFQLSLIYWIVAFWLPERIMPSLSPDNPDRLEDVQWRLGPGRTINAELGNNEVVPK